MIELTRCVRFSVPLDERIAIDPGAHNTFAGWPSMTGLGAYYELLVCCRGAPDPITGYLVNISAIDEAVRTHGIPRIVEAVQREPGRHPGRLLRLIVEDLRRAIDPRVVSVTWRLTPFYSLEVETTALERVKIRQQFEFAASHRLHCEELDEEANRSVFGKCNNAHGHGHNYRLEVAVSVPLPADGEPPAVDLAEVERIVDERVVQRFDHTNLNLDVPEFASLNPSVEHIARVCHQLLAGSFAAPDVNLEQVTVWETEKTSCTYPAGP